MLPSLRYASSLRGTRQYWFKQRSRLIAIVDTLGLPTIFFTHSAANLQWPELACLIFPDDLLSPTSYPSAYTLQFSRAYARPHNALHFTSYKDLGVTEAACD